MKLLSSYDELAAQCIAEMAAMYDFNGFSRDRLQRAIRFFLYNVADDTADLITKRARQLYKSTRRTLNFSREVIGYVSKINGSWSFCQDVERMEQIAHFHWVFEELAAAEADRDDESPWGRYF